MNRSRTELAVGARVEVRVERLAAGGDGVARIDGCVVFVPKSAPGDLVLVEIVTRAKNHLRGAVVEVREASLDRRDPLCGHFAQCGGCAWQHIKAEAQRAAKGAIVRDALERLAGIQLGAFVDVQSAAEYGYRSRAELSIQWSNGADGAPGYRRAGSHVVEVVRECPILVESLQRELEDLIARPERIPSGATRVHLAAGDSSTLRAFVDQHERPVGRGLEPRNVAQSILGLRYEFGARGFFQGNAALIEALVGVVLAGAEGREVLDLYCGAGLFALPLSRRFERVVGVDGEPSSVALARHNAAQNGVVNARFDVGDVAEYLWRARKVLQPDCVVLDPPRRGAGPDVIAEIARLGPHEVRYVSCDPATLARDLAQFSERGFEFVSIVVLDMFPQTPHVESVAILRNRAPSARTRQP